MRGTRLHCIIIITGSPAVTGSLAPLLPSPPQVIVLPDSGGLVLPLTHNGFLVGLLVVERCTEEDDEDEEMGSGAASSSMMGSANGGAQAGGAAGGEGPARMPPAPACLLFRSAELQLLKQTAAVLAMACAMDLRAALERAGAAYRQRQASALVQAVRWECTSDGVEWCGQASG